MDENKTPKYVGCKVTFKKKRLLCDVHVYEKALG
jgi:hypothetical protein